MVTSATAMGSLKSAGLSLLLLSFLPYVANSYPSIEPSNMGCEECTLRKNSFLSRERPVYQCMGCCFSRAYPTPLKAMKAMTNPKNITSEATCCVAKHSYMVRVPYVRQASLDHVRIYHTGGSKTVVGEIQVKNHTDCHCSTCIYHKI